MIVFKNLLEKLAESGWSTYRLRKEKIISSATLDRIRAGQSVSTETIDTVCRLCHCQPGDLMEFRDTE